MGKIIHTSIFKGFISESFNDDWSTITLKSDKNDFKIDLVDRFKEVLMNYRNGYIYKIHIFISDNKEKFEDVDGNWSIVEDSNYMEVKKNSRDVQYFDDWEDTIYYTHFKIGTFDVYDFLKSRKNKWAYIKFDCIKI